MEEQATTLATLRSRVELVSPLPDAWIPLLWGWLRETPDANFDDDSPTTYDAFVDEMRARQARGERSWGVRVEGVPVGAIGYLPMTARLGVFHGICMRRSACGTGIAAVAVQRVLNELFASGVDKVCAYAFATNTRVAVFFDKLGAELEGVQRAQVIQHGRPIDLRLMAFFNPARRKAE